MMHSNRSHVMQKSTPISQLPVNFVQNHPSAPPPTTPPQEIIEDVTTIQDALDALNTNADINDYPAQMSHHEYQVPDVHDDTMHAQDHVDIDFRGKIINELLAWNDDIKVALFATAAFLLIHVFPIEHIVYKYISLNKIPHSNILIKATLMFVAVLILSKLF